MSQFSMGGKDAWFLGVCSILYMDWFL